MTSCHARNTVSESVLAYFNDNITSTSMELNLFVKGEDGQLIPSALAEPQQLNNGINITVYTKFSMTSEELPDSVYADIYCFCNGYIIKHSNNENNESSNKTRHIVKTNSENTFNLYIPPTDIGNADEALLWIYINFVPDYIPKDNTGSICTSLMWYLPVNSKGIAINNNEYSVYEASEKDYINNKHPIYSDGEAYNTPYADIGAFSEELSSIDSNNTDHILLDNDNLCIAAYFDGDYDYYLAVLQNGEIADIFNGHKFMKINCNNCNRMIKYNIDNTKLHSNTTCSYQVIAMPVKIDSSSNTFNYFTGKVNRISIN